jgi:hypothetical protein
VASPAGSLADSRSKRAVVPLANQLPHSSSRFHRDPIRPNHTYSCIRTIMLVCISQRNDATKNEKNGKRKRIKRVTMSQFQKVEKKSTHAYHTYPTIPAYPLIISNPPYIRHHVPYSICFSVCIARCHPLLHHVQSCSGTIHASVLTTEDTHRHHHHLSLLCYAMTCFIPGANFALLLTWLPSPAR